MSDSRSDDKRQDIVMNSTRKRRSHLAIYDAARHPKSFVSLDSANHMLSKAADANYAADVIPAWIKRYIPAATRKNLVAKVI